MAEDKVSASDRVTVGLARVPGEQCPKCGCTWTTRADGPRWRCKNETCKHVFTPGN